MDKTDNESVPLLILTPRTARHAEIVDKTQAGKLKIWPMIGFKFNMRRIVAMKLHRKVVKKKIRPSKNINRAMDLLPPNMEDEADSNL